MCRYILFYSSSSLSFRFSANNFYGCLLFWSPKMSFESAFVWISQNSNQHIIIKICITSIDKMERRTKRRRITLCVHLEMVWFGLELYLDFWNGRDCYWYWRIVAIWMALAWMVWFRQRHSANINTIIIGIEWNIYITKVWRPTTRNFSESLLMIIQYLNVSTEIQLPNARWKLRMVLGEQSISRCCKYSLSNCEKIKLKKCHQ